MRIRLLSIGFVPILLGTVAIIPASAGPPSHGISYFGNLKYPKDFPHYDYVSPDAPKGGRMRASRVGSFNNLHPYVDKGYPAAGMALPATSLIYDNLMNWSDDEVGSQYGNLAESVEVADDYSWVAYTLRDNAYWHDGERVTVEDVLWTFNTIKTQGSVGWKNAYKDIVSVEQTGPWTLEFHFSETAEKTPQLALQTARFAPLPKHYWKDRTFNATTLETPLGSGPYRIKEVDAGHEIVFERVADYWGKDLNVNIGHNNFDRIEIIYFFDKNVIIQALKSRVVDYYRDQNEKDFATAYDFDGLHKGLFKKESYTMGMPYGMHFGVVFNTRKEKLSDVRVREALTLAYNFEWPNRVLWYGAMKRNNSYFMGSDMAATGLPSAAELELLEPFRDQIPARVFTHEVALPENEAFGRNRDTLLQADTLLKEAGWVVNDFKRVNQKTGEPFTLEFVVVMVEHERMLFPYVDNLERLGIESVLRRVQSNQVVNRLRNYDFEATILKYYQFKIPIPSMIRGMFLSRYADQPNMGNFAGIKSPAVDFLVERIISAASEEEMNVAGRALDRVLLWSFYLIPEGYPGGRHLVYWDRFGHPPLGVETMNWTGFPHLWWFDKEKSARVDAGIAELKQE